VDNDVYVWSEKSQKIERISSSHHTLPLNSSGGNYPAAASRVPQKYAKTLLEIDEDDLQSRSL
jgi:hypothetical protein